MKSISGCAAILLSLTLTAPSWAMDYTGSAVLDWSSLTFSGVAVDLIPQYQGQGSSVSNLVAVPFTSIDGSTYYELPPGPPVAVSNFGTLPDLGWTAHTTTATAASLGTASSTFDATTLSATVNLHGVSSAQSGVEVNGFLVAHTTGTLTVNIGYTISHEFAPASAGLPDFSSHSHLQLIVTDHTGQMQSSILDQYAPPGSSSQSGILSVTQQLTAGMRSFFTVSTSMDVNHPLVASSNVQTVPVPDMLWPTVLGMIGVAWYVRRRQRAH